ncbi:MAG: thiolase family protein [Acidobacteria bacterium]|nr:thiolase family protein [Acidobacteriaceae bacterium]MBV9609651.1 thiolase family protein [Acidobacteriota bacterium]
MNKRIFIAAYNQSKFGKLMAMTVPQIVRNAVESVCRQISVPPSAMDVGSIGAACNFSLNEQGLLSGLMAMVPGMEGKPIEAVENACASGGQAVLSVAQKLQLGLGEVGVAVGYEKMRDNEGKMDGKLIGKVLGYFSYPDEREGKTFVFPHLFAEVMQAYMNEHNVSEQDLAEIAVQEYANAKYNSCAQMSKVQITLDQAMKIEGINRYVVDGLPLKTYDCSQITDGFAALVLATEEGLRKLGIPKNETVEIAGFAQATDPLRKEGRDVLRAAGAYKAMNRAYNMAGLTPKDVNVAEVHDCFTVMGAIGTEVIGKAEYGQGAKYWVDGKARVDGECAINTSGGLIAKGHPVGATGIAMIGWAAQQLLGKAPQELQVKEPRAAATFNIGGPICASVCTVLKAAA